MKREKKTLWKRIRRNTRRIVTRPLGKPRKAPGTHREEDLVDLQEFTGLEREGILAYLDRHKGRGSRPSSSGSRRPARRSTSGSTGEAAATCSRWRTPGTTR